MRKFLLLSFAALMVTLSPMAAQAQDRDHHGDREAERIRCEERRLREEHERWVQFQREQDRMEAIINGTPVCCDHLTCDQRALLERRERDRREAQRLHQQQGTW